MNCAKYALGTLFGVTGALTVFILAAGLYYKLEGIEKTVKRIDHNQNIVYDKTCAILDSFVSENNA